MDRHISIAGSLGDSEGIQKAYDEMGLMAKKEGSSGEAMTYFRASLERAVESRNQRAANVALVRLGVTEGQSKYEEYMRNVAFQLSPGGRR